MSNFEKIKVEEQQNYGELVQKAQLVYEKDLSDDFYMMGERLYKTSQEKRTYPFNPVEWVAWMVKVRIKEGEGKVLLIADSQNSKFWLENVFKKFHGLIANYLNMPVYYYIDGKVCDLYGYDKVSYKDLSPGERGECDTGWCEVKQNIKKILSKGKKKVDEPN